MGTLLAAPSVGVIQCLICKKNKKTKNKQKNKQKKENGPCDTERLLCQQVRGREKNKSEDAWVPAVTTKLNYKCHHQHGCRSRGDGGGGGDMSQNMNCPPQQKYPTFFKIEQIMIDKNISDSTFHLWSPPQQCKLFYPGVVQIQMRRVIRMRSYADTGSLLPGSPGIWQMKTNKEWF